MKLLKRIALSLGLIITIPVALALIGTFVPWPIAAEPSAAPTKRILILSNPIHTDIAIPVEPESLGALPFLAEAGLPVTHPDARWLLIGWGAREFYTRTPSFAEMQPGPTFKALTFDAATMHVDVVGDIAPDTAFALPVDISAEGYARLLTAMSASFTRRDGQVIPIEGYALGTADRFFEGEGVFTAILGCNTWSARMLREAGLRTGIWNPLPISLSTSLRLFNEVPPA